jgi:hypothetical protein
VLADGQRSSRRAVPGAGGIGLDGTNQGTVDPEADGGTGFRRTVEGRLRDRGDAVAGTPLSLAAASATVGAIVDVSIVSASLAAAEVLPASTAVAVTV